MISTWQFITPPSGISMTASLQPLRSASDLDRYGIDTAWLWEVMSVWRAIQSTQSPPLATMSIHPTAAQTNAIRALATDIRTEQLTTASSTRATFDSSMRSAAFGALADLASLKVAFGTVPADVASGDAVACAHVADMFAWIQNAVCVHFSQSYTSAISAFTMDEDTREGNSSGWSPLSPSANTLELWQWGFWDWSGSRRPELTGGGTRRQYASDFTVSATLPVAKAYWFKSAIIFLKVGSSRNSTTAYVPLGTATISQSGSDVQISAICSAANGVVQAAMDTLSVSEVPYKTGVVPDCMTYEDVFTIDAKNEIVCFLELADDYRYPVASA